MYAKAYLLALARRPVTAYDEASRLVCLLCTEVPSRENGRVRVTPEGGMAVRYTLAPAFWADGQAVTSADVVFSWQVGRDPAGGYAEATAYRRIQSITTEDERSFTVHLDRRVADFASLPLEILPAHLEQAAFATPDRYRHTTTFVAAPTTPGLYNGPYRLAEFSAGDHAVFERNPHWPGAPPGIDRIIVRAVENGAALEAALLAGTVDYVPGELGLAVEQAQALASRHPDRFQVINRTALHYEHIDLPPGHPALGDVRVRRALLHAVDREALAARLFGGLMPVAHALISPPDRLYAADIHHYGYDPARAAALLDAAGWRLGADGLRRNDRGESLAVDLVTTAGSRPRELVQQVLQAQWRAVGIAVHLRTLPPRVFFADLTGGSLPAMAMFAWPMTPQQPPRAQLHSSQIPTAANGWSGYNFAGYRNPMMDDLIEALETELDDTARLRLWARLQALYAEDLPALPLFFRTEPHVMPPGLRGVTPTGHQAPATLWAEAWRME